MDIQNIVMGVLSIVGTIVLFLVTQTWNSIKTLQKQDEDLAEKINKIEILIASNYVKRIDFDNYTTVIFNKLDKIESKLDNRLDRHEVMCKNFARHND